MDIENSKAQMKKGVLELCILTIVSKKDCYASDIIGIMKEGDLIVVEGTLYPLLTRLKNDGLLAYRWEESTQGPPRKYYKITENGESYLKSLIDSWQELVNAINNIIDNK